MNVDEGVLPPGLPYLKVGHGPPLLTCVALTPDHSNPTGLMRRVSLAWTKPYVEHFTVYLVNRKVGLEAGTTMSDIAGHYASAIEEHLEAPVLLYGSSTGGSVALQLAVDRPELVSRLVLGSAACRLSEHGRRFQDEVARRAREEGVRSAWAHLTSTIAPPPLRGPARGLVRLAGRAMDAMDPADLLATIAAEDEFDVEPRLGRVTAPTLVTGGSRDPFYSEDLFRRTAGGIPRGRAVVFPGKGHAYGAGSKAALNLALGFLLG
jgi:pimeloyl-ACP methyl ester carboxylesterase